MAAVFILEIAKADKAATGSLAAVFSAWRRGHPSGGSLVRANGMRWNRTRFHLIPFRSSLVLGAAEDAGRLVAVARAGRAELAADADHAATRSRAGEERPVDGHRVAAGGGGNNAAGKVGAG